MGVHICVFNREGREHPDWDWIRHAGDREFATMVANLPKDEKHWAKETDFELHLRPTDFAVWRKAIAAREWPNPGRFEKLMDLLEREPDYWLYFSY